MFAVIINPLSGGGRKPELPGQIAALLRERGEAFRVYETKVEGDAALRVRQAIDEGCTSVICAGGDGTLCDVASELCGKPITFYAVPNGTGNDFARAFGLSRDPMQALREQLDGVASLIDCGRVNDRCFLNVAGSGFDVDVLRKTAELKKIYPGEKAYHKAVLSVLGNYRAFEAEVTIDGGETLHTRATIVEIANGRCIGGGMRVAPDALIDDGLFDVVIVKKVPGMLIPFLLPLLIRGLHIRLGFATMVRAKRVVMRAPNMTVNIDGELADMEEARFEILPGALRMMRPAAAAKKQRAEQAV